MGMHMTKKDANQAATKTYVDYIKNKKGLKIIDINWETLKDAQAEIGELSRRMCRALIQKNKTLRELLKISKMNDTLTEEIDRLRRQASN